MVTQCSIQQSVMLWHEEFSFVVAFEKVLLKIYIYLCIYKVNQLESFQCLKIENVLKKRKVNGYHEKKKKKTLMGLGY